MRAPAPLFRMLEGPADLHGMHAVSLESLIADRMDMVPDFESFCAGYDRFMNSLPSGDVLVVENDGKIIGHAMAWWRDVVGGPRLYSYSTAVLPGHSGARVKMMEWAENRLADIDARQGFGSEKTLETQAVPGSALDGIVAGRGYKPARMYREMTRPLGDSPTVQAPPSVEVRAASEDELKEAWRVSGEAFRDQWSFTESNWSKERLDEIMASPFFDPSLWFVAVSDSEIIGSVRNYIKPYENELFGRKRGYLSALCVLRPWRKKGVASALLSRSMAELSSRGMSEIRLGVDSESLTGAVSLYEKAGFKTSNTYVSYWKPMP